MSTERHLLAIPFETDFSYEDVVTEENDPETAKAQRQEYQRRLAEAVAALLEQMSSNPLARDGYLFGSPAEAKELNRIEGLTAAAYEEDFWA